MSETTTTTNAFENARTLGKRIMALAIVAAIVSACVILEINQEAVVGAGTVTTVTLTVQEPEPDANPWRGVIMVLVPSDWGFVSGTYDASDDVGAVGAGVLEEATAWADSAELALPAPDGMKWVGAISDTGYVHQANLTVETSVELQVGDSVGTFPLGYVVTKESYAIRDWFGPAVVGADSAMNQTIEVVDATAIEDVIIDGVPSQFVLEQNYPNPFNPSTKIRYALEEPAEVRLSVFDLSGKVIEVLDGGLRSAGVYEATFDGTDLTSGTYLYRLEAGNFVETRSMVLVK